MDDQPSPTAPPNCSDVVTINGVTLPKLVTQQLRMLGLPLAWYTHGELEEAVQACALDCTLIDDTEGVDFRDRLHLTEAERALRPLLKPKILSVETFGVAEFAGSFVERLNAEREARSVSIEGV